MSIFMNILLKHYTLFLGCTNLSMSGTSTNGSDQCIVCWLIALGCLSLDKF